MNLKHLRIYHGPNVISAEPVVSVLLDADADELAYLSENAGILRDKLGLPRGGEPLSAAGFLLDLAILMLNRTRGKITEKQVIMTDAGVVLGLGYHVPNLSLSAIGQAAKLVVEARQLNREKIEQRIDDFGRSCQQDHPDYQAEILIDFARRRDIPFFGFLPATRLWQFGWGARSRAFIESLTNADGSIASVIARNKVLNKRTFQSFGVPSPRHIMVSDRALLAKAGAAIGFPCVVKPVDRGGGKGVSANVANEAELHQAFDLAKRLSTQPIMVEERVAGDEHRLMTVAGKFACAIRREPPCVTGDGDSTIRQLIERLNTGRSGNPARGLGRPVTIDEIVKGHLTAQGLSLDQVPPAGLRISLRSNSNLSTGGTATDVTHQVDPGLRAMVEQLAQSIGFDIGGFDYITTDIARSPWETDGAFIEMNTAPGLDVCLTAGVAMDAILEPAFRDVGRIPASLTISSAFPGDAEPAACPASGKTIVWQDRLRVDDCEFRIAPAEGWPAVQAGLRNRRTQSIEIHATREEIVTRGLPLDRFDRITVSDPDFPGDWRAVLRACADEVSFLD